MIHTRILVWIDFVTLNILDAAKKSSIKEVESPSQTKKWQNIEIRMCNFLPASKLYNVTKLKFIIILYSKSKLYKSNTFE